MIFEAGLAALHNPRQMSLTACCFGLFSLSLVGLAALAKPDLFEGAPRLTKNRAETELSETPAKSSSCLEPT